MLALMLTLHQVSYNTAIKACDKLSDAHYAIRLLREAKESSVVPDVFTYNSVISACGHRSLWQVHYLSCMVRYGTVRNGGERGS